MQRLPVRAIRRLALGFASALALAGAVSPALAGDITYPGLNTAPNVQDTDLLATWRASGPLTKVQASVLNAYIQSKLNPVYLQIGNNLSELSSTAATARLNLGLGSAALANTGTSGTALCQMNFNCTWSGTETFNAAVTMNGGVTVNGGTITGIPGRLLNIQVFTSSGTYTPDAGTNSVIVDCQGAGGASGGIAATGTGTGISGAGSPGTYARARYISGFSGVTVTIGAAGTGVSGGGGNTGGTTSFGALLSCPGGLGGSGTVIASGTTGAISSGSGSLSAPSGSGIIFSSGQLQQSGASFIASPSVNILDLAKPSFWGGYSYGFGGSGRTSPPSSGAIAGNNGGGGLIIVYEFS